MTTIDNIPRSLAERPIWLCYRLEDRGKGRLSKPPVSPKTGRVCSKTDETEQVTLTEALVGMEHFNLDGVGIVLADSIICIDLDDCFEDTGELKEIPQSVYDHFSETYIEYSPSGNGLHIFFFGTKPNARTKDSALGIEVYAPPNFLTVTGDRVDGTGADAIPMQDSLDWLFSTYLPPIVSENAERPPVDHGERTADEWLAFALSKDLKLRDLHNSTEHDGDESSTDFALLAKLAYWLNRDTDAMDAAFRASPWAHSKSVEHTRKLDRADYLPNSVEKAAQLCRTTAAETARLYETKAVRFFTLTPDEDGTEPISPDVYTDLGNAEAMAAVFGDNLCYTPEWGWCFFDGSRWQIDVSYRAMEAAKDIAKGLMVSAKDWLDRVNAEIDGESDE